MIFAWLRPGGTMVRHRHEPGFRKPVRVDLHKPSEKVAAGCSASSAVRHHVIADVAAENPDGGANQQCGEFGELFHFGVASVAAAHRVMIRRIWRNIRVARRHPRRPVSLRIDDVRLAWLPYEIV